MASGLLHPNPNDEEVLRWIFTLIAALNLASATGIITHGPRDLRRIALTFDADMTPGMAQNLRSGRVKSYDNTRIYQILQRYNTKATFFLSGMWIELYPQETKNLAQNPLFELENHSYSHPGFEQPCYGLPRVARTEKAFQIKKTKELLKLVGVENRFFRFPGGCASASDVAVAEHLGLKVVHWDVVGGDADQHNPDVIITNVLEGTRNGSIIVLHSHGGPRVPVTAEALEKIIPALKAEGYQFVKLSELLGGQGIRPYIRANNQNNKQRAGNSADKEARHR